MTNRRILELIRREGREFRPDNGWTFSLVESAQILPQTSIWVASIGIVQTGTVVSWSSGFGGVSTVLTSPASTNEPTYNATGGVGGRPSVTFDGVDNFLRGTMTKGSAFTDHEIGIVGERVAFGTLGDIWFGYWLPNSAAFYLNDNSASTFRFTSLGAANVTVSNTYDPDGVIGHYSGDSSTGVTNVRVNGEVVATAAASPTSRADGNTVIMGASQTSVVGPYGTVAANVIIHAAHIGPALSNEQRTYLRALLSHYTGVSC